MRTEVLNAFFRQSGAWTSRVGSQEFFSDVAAFFADRTDLDCGLFLYRKHDTSDEFAAQLAIYEPWGVFKGQESLLQRLGGWAYSEFGALTSLMEQWVTPEAMPTNVRRLLHPFGLSKVGIWPIRVNDTLTGGIVVGRAKSSSSFLPQETQTVLMNAVSSQLSLTLNLIRAVRLAEAASHRDPLTGLYNRRGLEANLPSMTRRAEQACRFLGFLLIDLNGLKSINDTHGHPIGDEVLKGVGSIILQSVGKDALVARYGGDEFVVVLQMDNSDVADTMRRIQEAVEERSGGRSVSVGGALLGIDGDLGRCYDIADRRLYEGKRFIKTHSV